MPHMNHLESAARRKLKMAEGWKAYKFEAIDDYVLVEGSVPVGFTKKGQPKWKGEGQKTIVTKGEVEQEEKLYEETTGNCCVCFGEGKVVVAFGVNIGTRYAQCSKCQGSGRRP